MTDQERNDREAIRVLMARYNINGDQGRIKQLAATFADDGVLHFNDESTQGREAIAKRLSSGTRNPALTVTRHHLGTSLVELDGETATGRTYFHVLTDIGPDHHGVYVDRFLKAGGEWLIAHRQVRIDWQSPQSLNAPLWVRGVAPAQRQA
ncbi:MAG: nuclear transport factor 2 family protein [Sphingomonadaceae bacterium]|nr:nuclear transport factor 2 family protein [Sphingomonadaceae bacterium]